MERRKPRDIEPILKEVRKTLERIYGDRLKSIILYGSYARGDATEGSDIDFILLLESIEDFHAEVDRLLEVTWPLDLKYDTIIILNLMRKGLG